MAIERPPATIPAGTGLRLPNVTDEYRTSDTSRMSIADLTAATNATFESSIVAAAHTPSQFAEFCRCYALDVAESICLQDRSGRVAGLAMLGIRGERGWCGGLGLVPEIRGLGLSKHLAEALIRRSRYLGLRSLQLEVLAQNEPALRLYRRAGFRETRETISFCGNPCLAIDAAAEEAIGTQARRISIERGVTLFAGLPDEESPVWSREPASLLALSRCEALEMSTPGESRAVAVFRTPPGDPMEILLLRGNDPAATSGILSAVARIGIHRGMGRLSVLCEPSTSRCADLMTGLGFGHAFRQFEMRLLL